MQQQLNIPSKHFRDCAIEPNLHKLPVGRPYIVTALINHTPGSVVVQSIVCTQELRVNACYRRTVVSVGNKFVILLPTGGGYVRADEHAAQNQAERQPQPGVPKGTLCEQTL